MEGGIVETATHLDLGGLEIESLGDFWSLCPHLQGGRNYSYKSLNELYVNYNVYFPN